MDFKSKFVEEYGLFPYNPLEESLYKYVSIGTAIKILQNTSLKFSTAAEFNDPFELSVDSIDFTATPNDLKALIDRTHKGARYERRKLYKEHKKNTAALFQPMHTEFNKMRDSLGICCFSQNYNHTLMWSHYSNNHYGVCLGFENIKYGNDLLIFQVKYVDKFEPLNYWQVGQKSFPLWVYTKSHVWSYEEEVRAVHVNYNGLIGFPPACLTKIYFGLRTPPADIDVVEQLIKAKGYTPTRYKMQRVPSTFDIIARTL